MTCITLPVASLIEPTVTAQSVTDPDGLNGTPLTCSMSPATYPEP